MSRPSTATPTAPSTRSARLGDLRRWPASALLLRVVMLLAPLGALLLAGGAGDPPPASVLAGVALASLGFAVAPESGFGLLALGSVVGWWCLADDGLHASVLVATVLLTLAHVAGLLAAYGPSGARVEPALASVWILRGTAVLLAAPLVWVVARVVDGASPVAALWQAGLLVSVLAVVAAARALAQAPPHE